MRYTTQRPPAQCLLNEFTRIYVAVVDAARRFSAYWLVTSCRDAVTVSGIAASLVRHGGPGLNSRQRLYQ